MGGADGRGRHLMRLLVVCVATYGEVAYRYVFYVCIFGYKPARLWAM